jgi:hypothetical protein
MVNEDFIVRWFHRKRKLDKTCKLYDRKAEKIFKEYIEEFINWLE